MCMAERDQVIDDRLLVSCSALRVCVLLESGSEYSRIEWRCVESTAKCDVTTVRMSSPCCINT
eukprot:COSAG06_NODE_26_length_32102_cov_250.952911_3_plen_63_part_00